MRVQKITIRNIMGIEELEFEPGALTRIEGANGSGKTSTIEALKSLIEGGHDATLIRTGAEEGEVVFLFDDGVEARERVTQARTDRHVTHPELGKVGSPASYLKAITDALSTNPVAFLTAKKEDRARLLLEALPLELDAKALEGAVGDVVADADIQGHPLAVIERIRSDVYDERTGVNRAAKEKRATVEQLRGSLPDDAPDAARLAKQIEEVEAAREAVRSEARAELDALSVKLYERTNTISSTYEGKIEALRAKIADLQERQSTELMALRDEVADERQAVEGAAKERVGEHAAQLATLRQQAEEAGRAQNTRQMVERMAGEVGALEAKSKAMTQALARLDALKLDMLETLPIKGAEVRDGEIVDAEGIPFDRWNRERQVRFAIDLARLRAGKLPLILADGLECLDAETYEAFCAAAEEADGQIVVTRVTDTPYAVTTGAA